MDTLRSAEALCSSFEAMFNDVKTFPQMTRKSTNSNESILFFNEVAVSHSSLSSLVRIIFDRTCMMLTYLFLIALTESIHEDHLVMHKRFNLSLWTFCESKLSPSVQASAKEIIDFC